MRLEIMGEVQHKMRDVRAEGAAVSHQGVRDEAESSEAEIQDDIEFALYRGDRSRGISILPSSLEPNMTGAGLAVGRAW